MPKITQPYYSLPTIFAETLLSDFTDGTNLPVLISGKDSNKLNDGNYVLKMMSSERMSPNAFMKELLASFISSELNIPIPEPVLVFINDDFANSLLGDSRYHRLLNSIGLNFGSKYYPGFVPWTYDKLSFTKHEIDLQKIFIFDLFVDNPDRTIEKPNIMTDYQSVMILDHEIAFGFTQLVFGDYADKELVTQTQLKNLNKHILYQYLRGCKFQCDSFMDTFININDIFWDKVTNLIPVEWQSDQLLRIKKVLDFKVNNLSDYKTEIRRCLL